MSMPAVFVRVSLGHVGDSFEPIETISSSDLTLGILDIPKSRFGCAVESVTAKIKNAEGATMNIPALLKGNVWTATFPRSHFERPGVSTLGVEIAIFGLDENGNVRDWIAGRGDLVVHDSEGGSVIPGEHFQNLHWYDEPPINPERGAVAPIDDVAKVWNGSGWIDLGGGGGVGATVLTIVGSKVMNGEKEIATYAELLALVQSGGVVLLDTVAGQIAKSALFHPHMADSSAIRFDATGTLGDKVYTRAFAFTPKTGGGIAISRGDLIEVAKSTQLTWGWIANKPNFVEENLTLRNFNRGAVNDTAILTSFKVPQALADRAGSRTIVKIRMQGPTTSTGSWDSHNVRLSFTQYGVFSIWAASTAPVEVGKPIEFIVQSGFMLSSVDELTFSILSANNRSKFGLVSVDSSEGYDLTLSNGNHLTNFAPFLEFVFENGEIVTTYARSIGDKVEAAGATKALATNASQAQIIAKINELISYLK